MQPVKILTLPSQFFICVDNFLSRSFFSSKIGVSCTVHSGERGDIRRKRQVSLHWAAKDGEKSQQGGRRGDQFLVAPSGVNRGEEGEISFWLPQAEFFHCQ